MDLTSYITDFKLFSRTWKNHIYLSLFHIRCDTSFIQEYVFVSVVYETTSKTVFSENIFSNFNKKHF